MYSYWRSLIHNAVSVSMLPPSTFLLQKTHSLTTVFINICCCISTFTMKLCTEGSDSFSKDDDIKVLTTKSITDEWRSTDQTLAATKCLIIKPHDVAYYKIAQCRHALHSGWVFFYQKAKRNTSSFQPDKRSQAYTWGCPVHRGRRWKFVAGGSKVRESGGRKSPSGVQGRSPGRRSGGQSPQKLKHVLKNRY